MKKTSNADTTELAMALKKNNLNYKVIDYTRQTYDILRKKREVILKMKDEFESEKLGIWYKVIKGQTDCVTTTYEEYIKENCRYIYIVSK